MRRFENRNTLSAECKRFSSVVFAQQSALRAGTLLTACLMLSSCGNFDRDYRLRFWEKCRIEAEAELQKKHMDKARALDMALEAIHQADKFGDSDFRLGVSYSDYADVLKIQEKYKAAEKYYLKAVKVFEANEVKAVADENADAKANRRRERATNELMRRLGREDMANTLSHLAGLYALQERHQEASDNYERASAIYQSMIGFNQWHLDDCPMGQELVQCLVGLAQASVALKKYDSADGAYKKALEIAAASNCPEFTLRDIRDEYLQLLERLGKTNEAKPLLSDVQFTQLTSAGIAAMFKEDLPVSENCFRQAFVAAQQSFFSQRRLMRAMCNLQTIFAHEKNYPEMERVFVLARNFMQSRGLRFDRDYDAMLTNEANYLTESNRPQAAVDLLNQQYRYRFMYYGPESVKVCETLALRGHAELKGGRQQDAIKTADFVFQAIEKKHKSNRRAGEAMKTEAQLVQDLGRFEQAEILTQQLADVKLKVLPPTDPLVIGYKANIFVLDFHFQRHDKAEIVVKDIIQTLEKGSTVQRIEAMPYLVLIQSYALALNWWDLAEPVTVLGQSILKKEMAGMPMAAMNQDNWNRDIAKLEQHTGKKY